MTTYECVLKSKSSSISATVWKKLCCVNLNLSCRFIMSMVDRWTFLTKKQMKLVSSIIWMNLYIQYNIYDSSMWSRHQFVKYNECYEISWQTFSYFSLFVLKFLIKKYSVAQFLSLSLFLYFSSQPHSHTIVERLIHFQISTSAASLELIMR